MEILRDYCFALQPFADLQEFLSFVLAVFALLLFVLVLEFALLFVFEFVLLFVLDELSVVLAGVSANAGAAVAPRRPVIAAATRRDFTEFFIFDPHLYDRVLDGGPLRLAAGSIQASEIRSLLTVYPTPARVVAGEG